MKPKITLKVILDIVAEEFEVSTSDLVAPDRSNATARYVYAYLARKFTSKTNAQISSFVCRNYKLAETVITKINIKMQWDGDLSIRIEQLENHFKGLENATD